MKKVYIMVLLVLAGCGLLNRSTKTTEKSYNESNSQIRLRANAAVERKMDSQQWVYKKDSAAANYTVHFWPKGTLNFSADGKFTGEFDSILMVGKQDEQSASLALLESHERNSKVLSVEENSANMVQAGKENTQKISTPDWKMGAIILITLFIVVFIVGKRMVYGLK